MTDAEVGCSFQTKESQGLRTRGKEEARNHPPRSFRESMPRKCLASGFTVSRMATIRFCCFKLPSLLGQH